MEDWRSRAECRGLPADVFFRDDQLRRARAVCAACEVRGVCLDEALKENDPFGVRGGLDPGERITEKRRRQRKRLAAKAAS